MSEQEINKIISEYMFPEFKRMEYVPQSYIKCQYYTTSLDACMPVVEKLKAIGVSFEIGNWLMKENFYRVRIEGDNIKIFNKGETLALALATASAEAIKSLKEA